jgi:hypothetical protein
MLTVPFVLSAPSEPLYHTIPALVRRREEVRVLVHAYNQVEDIYTGKIIESPFTNRHTSMYALGKQLVFRHEALIRRFWQIELISGEEATALILEHYV